MSFRHGTAVTNIPCTKCPFRKDISIYLRNDRRQEIAETLLRGAEFPCHGEVDYDVEWDDEDMGQGDASGARMCAGAAKSLLRDGVANQMMRIHECLGLADYDVLETQGAEVWPLSEWVKIPEGVKEGDDFEVEDILTCSVVNAGCIAPAGYAYGNGVLEGTEAADCECSECGEPVCSECIRDDGLCDFCGYYVDDDEDSE